MRSPLSRPRSLALSMEIRQLSSPASRLLTTTAISSSPAGSYPITAALGTLAAANYSFTFGTGTLTITPASNPGVGFTGRAMAGTQPITGATVQVYAAGTAGNGSAGTALLTSPLTTDSSGALPYRRDTLPRRQFATLHRHSRRTGRRRSQ